jgi:chromosome segregation ATPase
MSLFSRHYVRSTGFILLAADKESTGSAEGGATLKQRLEKAEAALTEANASKETAETQSTEALAKLAGIEKDLEAAKAELAGAAQAKTDLETALNASKAETAKLEATAKSTDVRAAEIAAAAGVTPVAKAPESTAAAQGKPDGQALFDKYTALMDSDPAQASAFWNENEKALMTFANSVRGN